VNRAVRDGARRVLAEIDEALEDMRIGRYGQCWRCGERIPWSVLLAVPRTRLCLSCQNTRSDQESRPASAGKSQRGGPSAPREQAEAAHGGQARFGARWFRFSRRRKNTGGEQPSNRDTEEAVLWVRGLLGGVVLGERHQHLGRVADLVVRHMAEPPATVVTGLIIDGGGHRVHVPVAAISGWCDGYVQLCGELAAWQPSRPDGGQVCLASALGKSLLSTPKGRRADRIGDIGLRHSPAGWLVWVADTRTQWQRLLRRPRRLSAWTLRGRRQLFQRQHTEREHEPVDSH
jgi:hypothetical protein